MVTICARGNDGVEVVCRRGFVELGDGLEVQRSMGREVPIDHRGIRGLRHGAKGPGPGPPGEDQLSVGDSAGQALPGIAPVHGRVFP